MKDILLWKRTGLERRCPCSAGAWRLPKGASLHVLRHSDASLLLEKGVDIATVSERLGHSSVATTAAIYSHAIRHKDHAAAQVWDDLMQQARGEKSAGVN